MEDKTKQCIRCGKEYLEELLRCPKCGLVDEKMARQIKDFEEEALRDSETVMWCICCSSIYPVYLSECPYCNSSAEKLGARMSSEEAKRIVTTPIQKLFDSDGNIVQTDVDRDARENKYLSLCRACGRKISPQAESCPHCGQPTGVHICPKCGSTNTKVISGASKATSLFLWGPFAANKVMSKYQCKDCLHKW